MPRSIRMLAAGARAASRPVVGAPLLCALGVALAAAEARPARAGTIEGQAFDREGRPLAGVTVTLVERTGGGMLSRSQPADQVLARTRTDMSGFFAFDTGPRDVRGRVLVRCGEGPDWDRVRYAAPPEVDVSRGLRDRGRAILSCVAEDAPSWGALVQEIERSGGPGSDRGRVLRRHGLPPQTVAGADGTTEWHYPGGVVYAFKDGVLVRGPAPATPGAPANAAAGGTGGSP